MPSGQAGLGQMSLKDEAELGGRRPWLPSTTSAELGSASQWSAGPRPGHPQDMPHCLSPFLESPATPSVPPSPGVWGVPVGPGDQSRACMAGRQDSRGSAIHPGAQTRQVAAGPGAMWGVRCREAGAMHRGRGAHVGGSLGPGRTAGWPKAMQRPGPLWWPGPGQRQPGGRQGRPGRARVPGGARAEPLSPALGGGTSRSEGTAWARRAAADAGCPGLSVRLALRVTVHGRTGKGRGSEGASPLAWAPRGQLPGSGFVSIKWIPSGPSLRAGGT